MASKAIGNLVFNFGANMQGFDRAMNKAQKKLNKFGKNITKTGKSLSIGLTLPIVGLAAAAVKLGSDFEETDSKFKAVFSSLQSQAENTAQTFAESFGLSDKAAKTLLGDTGDLLVGFGFTESAALDLSKQVNELAVDLASFTNFQGGAEGASKALTKALVGETESAKSLGIVIRQGTPEYKARTKAIMESQGVTELQAKAINNLEIAISQSGKAIGDFERTQDSFANQLRVVKGDLENVGAEMGMILLPMAKDLVAWFKRIVERFQALSPETKEAIAKFALLAAAIGPVLIIIGKLSLGIGALIPTFTKLSVFLAANPYILLAAAIVGTAVAVYKLVDAFSSQYDSQAAIGKLNEQAAGRISGDMAKVRELTFAIESENASLETKEKALSTLKALYPEYYGQLDLANLASQDLQIATDKLRASLMQTARMDVYTERLKEIEGALMDVELRDGEPKGFTKFLTSSVPALGAVAKLLEESTDGQLDFAGAVQKGLDTSSVEKLKKEQTDLLDLMVELENKAGDSEDVSTPSLTPRTIGKTDGKGIDDASKKIQALGLEMEKVAATSVEIPKTLEKVESIDFPEKDDMPFGDWLFGLELFLETWAEGMEEVLDIAHTAMSSIGGLIGEVGNKEQVIFDNWKKNEEDKMETMEEDYQKEKEALEESDAFKRMTEEDQKTALLDLETNFNTAKGEMEEEVDIREKALKKKQAIRDKGLAIAQAIINTAEAVTAVIANPVLALFVGGLGAAQVATIASTPIPFAEGGLISGPVNALIGEASNISNPEVIAPLDKLKEYIRGPEKIEVVGKISGTDIVLSSAKTNINRLRSV